ncbi:MAG TPA: hypothetical protein V6C97_04085 [Oculatellaceae cyanobacterium]
MSQDKITPAKPGDRATTPGAHPNGDGSLQQQATDLRSKPTDASKSTDTKPASSLQVDVAKVAERLHLSVQPSDLDVTARERQIRDTRNQLIQQMKTPGTDQNLLQHTQDTFKQQVNDATNVAAHLLDGKSPARPMDRINDSLATTERHQADLEKSMNITPANQKSVINSILAKDSSTITPQEKDYIETLTLKQSLRQAKESGSITNAVYGSAVAQGLIGDIKNRDANGMATPSAADISEAFNRMSVAHRLSGESRDAGPFADDFNKVSAQYAAQLDSNGKNIVQCLQLASDNYHKDPTAAENYLNIANKAVDGLNIQQLKDQLASNPDPAVADKINNILKVAENSRMDLANFYYDHGRMLDATNAMTKASAETPEQYAADSSVRALADKVGTKINADQASIDDWQTKYSTAIGQHNWADADVAGKHVQDALNQRIKQETDARTNLTNDINAFQLKMSNASPEDKAAMQKQLDAYNGQAQTLDLQKKLDTQNLALMSYRQGFVHLSEKNNAEAHSDFAAVSKIDPELAAKLESNPANGLPKLSELVDQTKEPSWWQSHWRMISGIAIGVAATAAVIATGGAALPAVAIVLAGGALYAGAGATAGETSFKQVATNFGTGCVIAGISVLTKKLPIGPGVGGVAGAATPALETVAAEGVKDVGTNVLGRVGSTLVQTGKNFFANPFTKEGLVDLSKQAGTAVTIEGAKVGIYDMGMKGQSWNDVKSKLLPETLETFALVRGGASLGSSSKYFSWVNKGIDGLGVNAFTTVGGYTMAGAPELYRYSAGKQDWDTTVKNTAINGSMDSLTLGMTSSATSKLFNSTTVGSIGSLNYAGLARGTVGAYVPYVIQEGVGVGIDKAAGLSKPLDVTTDQGSYQTTNNWTSNYENRVPDNVTEVEQ